MRRSSHGCGDEKKPQTSKFKHQTSEKLQVSNPDALPGGVVERLADQAMRLEGTVQCLPTPKRRAGRNNNARMKAKTASTRMNRRRKGSESNQNTGTSASRRI